MTFIWNFYPQRLDSGEKLCSDVFEFLKQLTLWDRAVNLPTAWNELSKTLKNVVNTYLYHDNYEVVNGFPLNVLREPYDPVMFLSEGSGSPMN